MDVSEIEFARDALARETQAHARTLDQLSTAVAIFDRSKRLVFHNAAYRQLWALDPAWLDQSHRILEILDRLRAARLLPEQADFRAWQGPFRRLSIAGDGGAGLVSAGRPHASRRRQS